jgi:hypothetical protein
MFSNSQSFRLWRLLVLENLYQFNFSWNLHYRLFYYYLCLWFHFLFEMCKHGISASYATHFLIVVLVISSWKLLRAIDFFELNADTHAFKILYWNLWSSCWSLFEYAASFLKLNKPITNRFGICRFTFEHRSRIASHRYNGLEPCKPMTHWSFSWNDAIALTALGTQFYCHWECIVRMRLHMRSRQGTKNRVVEHFTTNPMVICLTLNFMCSNPLHSNTVIHYITFSILTSHSVELVACVRAVCHSRCKGCPT